jgi:hypothetical protein
MGYWRRHAGQATGKLGIELSDGVRRLNSEFFGELDATRRSRLGITQRQIDLQRQRTLGAAYFSRGRYLLMQGDRQGARTAFWTALARGAAATKAKAMTGLLCAATGLNMERIVEFAGGERYV